MIGVEEAKKLISDNISPLKSILKPLEASSEHILAQDVFGAYDIPAFRQSSMDGYAIIFGDKDKELDLVGEMAAGTTDQFTLKNGQTSRIFTGAPLPQGADTIVMQEKTTVNNNKISFNDEKLVLSANVRQVGSEIRSGALAMQK